MDSHCIIKRDNSYDSPIEIFNLTQKSIAIILLSFHFHRIFYDLNTPFLS